MRSLILLSFLFMQIFAQESGIILLSTNTKADNIRIDWVLDVPQKIQSQSISHNGTELNITSITAPSEEIKTSIYFLIDSSSPMKKSFEEKIKPLIESIVDRLDVNRHIYQIATFDSQIDIIKNFDNEDNQSLLDNIKIDGQRTELYRLTLEALKSLSKQESNRKYLLIFSDGDYEDTAYSQEDIIKFAKNNSITILSFGYRDSIKLQSIRKLAEESGGKIWIENQSNSIDDILSYFDNGGRVEFSKIGLKNSSGIIRVILSVETLDGSFSKNIDIEVEKEIVKDDDYLIYLPLLLIPFLLIAWLLYKRSSKNQEEEGGVNEYDTPVTIYETKKDKVIASIETQSGATFDITKKLTSIGRSAENDITIDGIYISKYHADILFKNGNFYIIDKNSENGIRVNDSENSNQYELQDGDTIYLGPLELYFNIKEEF